MGPGRCWIDVAPSRAQTRILVYKATKGVPDAASFELPKTKIGKSMGIVLDTDDILGIFNMLKSNRVTILVEPGRQPYG